LLSSLCVQAQAFEYHARWDSPHHQCLLGELAQRSIHEAHLGVCFSLSPSRTVAFNFPSFTRVDDMQLESTQGLELLPAEILQQASTSFCSFLFLLSFFPSSFCSLVGMA